MKKKKQSKKPILDIKNNFSEDNLYTYMVSAISYPNTEIVLIKNNNHENEESTYKIGKLRNNIIETIDIEGTRESIRKIAEDILKTI